MKKVMKFVKGKKEDDSSVKNAAIEVKKLSIDKSDESLKDDDFIYRDKSVTKLHKAVWNENSEKLKSIIKTHDIDITDRLDRTALYLAVLKNNPNIINLLLENHANQNIPDIDGITPFLKSVQLGYKDCAATLINHGADLKKTDKDLNTCLHIAALEKHFGLLSFLLEYNVDCNTPNVNGDYPLHIAIKLQNIAMVELLLKNKSDINATNSSGLSAVTLAEQQKSIEIMSLLENYNVKTLNIPHMSDDISLKSSYENLKPEKYFSKNDSEATDTWNDSPISTPTKITKADKPVNIAMNVFNEEMEVTEETSEAEVSIKCSENTSPQSGIIPPPCKPLRSLEYLQSGMTMENRPVHLLTLGTVRTRHISMTESDHSKNNTPHRYSYQGDFQSPVTGEPYKIPDEKGDSIKSKLLSKLECDSTLQSDWGSNESLPLDEISFRKDKSNSNNSNSGSIRDKVTESFLQKQFSILEDYEKNYEKRSGVSYEMDLLQKNIKDQGIDIENLLEDNNRINTQLEKYVGQSDTLTHSTKSKSLPRNCEPYSSYHKGSHSLPRTLECGKDPFREMRNYGYFKPRSHFFSLKMLKGEKKNTFLDKLKSMFNKKSQIHLTDQESNGSWLYKEKYKIRSDHEFYSKLDTFSTSESSSSRKSHHSDLLNELRSGLQEMEEDEFKDLSFSNNEQNQVIEKKIHNMSWDSRNPSTSQNDPHHDCNYSVDEDRTHKDKSLFSLVKNSINEQLTDTQSGIICDDCSEYMNLKLAEAEGNLLGKEKIINLLKEQLTLLKDRNVKSIDEVQNMGFKYNRAIQELDSIKQICSKYETELQKIRLEKLNKQEMDDIAQKLKEDADKWKKQYEDLLGKINNTERAISEGMKNREEDWRNIVQNEVSTAVNILKENSQLLINSLEKQNKKLEDEVEKLQNEIKASGLQEHELQRELYSLRTQLAEASVEIEKFKIELKKGEEKINKLEKNNSSLKTELETITKLYVNLEKQSELNLKRIEQGTQEMNTIQNKYESLKFSNEKLQDSIMEFNNQINIIQQNSIEKIKKSYDELIQYDNPHISEFIENTNESLQTLETQITEKPFNNQNVIQICHDSISSVIYLNDLHLKVIIKLCEIKEDLFKKENKELDTTYNEIIKKHESKKSLLNETRKENENLMNKIEEFNEIMENISSDLKNKEDVLEMQSNKICDLKEILEDEIEKSNKLSIDNKSLKGEIENYKSKYLSLQQSHYSLNNEIGNLMSALQHEKSTNKKLCNDNIELRNVFEAFNKEKQAIEEQNIDLKSSFIDLEKENSEMHDKLSSTIISNQNLRKIIETSKEKMEKLEKINQQLHEKLSEQNQTDDRKLETLSIENNILKSHLEREKDITTSLKQHIDSLQFYHENEQKSNNILIEDLKNEISNLRCQLNNELQTINAIPQTEQKNKTKKLYETIIDLNNDIHMLNKKLLDIQNESSSNCFENIQILNDENLKIKKKIKCLQMELDNDKNDVESSSSNYRPIKPKLKKKPAIYRKQAINKSNYVYLKTQNTENRRDILSDETNDEYANVQSTTTDNSAKKQLEKIVEIDVASQKVVEKDIELEQNGDDDSFATDSYITESENEESDNNDLIKRISKLELAVGSIMNLSTDSDDVRTTSLPNLEVIKQNRNTIYTDIDSPVENGIQLCRKSSSLENIAMKTDEKLINSQTNLETCNSKGKYDNRWEKQLNSIQKIRTELNDILMKMNIQKARENADCSPDCTNKFKLVVDSLQRQVNELNIKSSVESKKCYGLQKELLGMKGQIVNKEAMEKEIIRLKKELYKQKVESVQEIEKCRIKKEAEILEIQFQMKQQYLEKKFKLLADLADVQQAFQKKTKEEKKMTKKCQDLMKKVTANQELRSIKTQQLLLQPAMHTNVDPVLQSGLREIFQPIQRQVVEHDVQECSSSNYIRTKLNTTIEKHRLDSADSVSAITTPEDENLRDKYLLQ